MSYRFMRMLLFFDLPTTTTSDLKEYQKFRKFLINNGFIMLQYSVYSKILLNQTSVNTLRRKLLQIVPEKGLIQILVVTEKQYTNIENIVGEQVSDIISNDERYIII